MATPQAIEKKRLAQAADTNRRLVAVETQLAEALDLLRQLTAGKPADDATGKPAAKKTAKAED